jgi:uncharacterized membrane protein YraQ (UPF0718 family)
MEKLAAFLLDSLAAAWMVFVESAPYMLFGFFIAGIIYVFLKPEKVARYFGGRGVRPVVLSALAGIPIPLCSCGVIPAAAGLKKQGASRGATLSFLISTPETGMDSIPITYALIDPLMTVIRPVAAFFTAVVAGIAESLLGHRDAADREKVLPAAPVPGARQASPATPAARQPLTQKVSTGMRYAFGELLGDIGPWFVFGILLAGLIITLVPDDLINGYLGNPLLAMAAMLVAGIPMYVCATSSTPIAAALILKGLNPGAALVFLLAGPATNVATLSMVSGMLGKRSVAIYLAAIVGCSFAMGLLVDFLYATFQIQPLAVAGQAAELLPEWMKLVSASILMLLLGRAFWQARRTPAAAPCTCSDSCCSNN